MRLRKLKDEDKRSFLYFSDGSKVHTVKRIVSTISNTVYFETEAHVTSKHGNRYMTTREGLVGWSVSVSLVSGVSDK